ncbi:Preprotein translocase subunit YajC [Lacticaseibacillus paracasei]|nr:Preprotein translocase subunit YajC [Lacticaseibacillus paracasei]
MTFWQIILAIMVVLVCLLYLVAIPLAKRYAMQKQADAVDQMHANLQIGDQIVLIDGSLGNIQSLNQEDVQVEIAEKTVITVKRMGIAGGGVKAWQSSVGQGTFSN